MTNDVKFGHINEFTAKEFETVLVDELIPYIDSNFRTSGTKSMTGTRQPSAGMDGHGNASVTGTWMHTRFVSSANGKAGSSRRSRCITSSLWQRAVITAKII